jgi:hypothetical protein
VTADSASGSNFNRYWYANNNPYKFTDPDGRLPILIPVVIFIAKELAAEGVEQVTGIPMPTVRRLGTRAAKEVGERVAKRQAARAGGEQAAKRGPKTDPEAPHNATIRTEGNRLADEGNEILAGGGRKAERLIPTPGGDKSGRRPDILYKTPEGEVRAVNVGRTNADGTPVKREVQAMKDLEGAGVKTEFKAYD